MPVAGRPQYGVFNELRDGERYCTCCKSDLSGHAFRWLELDQRTQTYHDFKDVPESQSQGWFPFGLTCARTLVVQETKRRISQPVQGK